MVDTAPPRDKYQGPKNYYKNGHRYADGYWPCENCLYGDNATCKECIFAVWNVDGIREGFMPSEAHRRAHPEEVSDAIRGSPLLEKFSTDHLEKRRYEKLHTPVGPSGITAEQYIDVIAKGAQEILNASGFGSIRVDADKVKRVMMGKSPIENGVPAAGSLPMQPTDIPGLPHGTVDPRTALPIADPHDLKHSLAMLYEARRNLDH